MQNFRISLLVTLFLFLFSAVETHAYDPPMGIPTPPFGIDERTPSAPAEWPSSQATGFYFVDNSNPNASDNDNEFGYPDRPRRTLPTSIGTWPAGTYIEVHGGPYSVSGDQWRVNTAGTSQSPTWLVGDPNNKPVFRFELIIERTSYLVVENLRFDTHRQWIRTSGQSNNLVFRFNELTGNPSSVDRTSMISVGGSSSGRSSDVVIFANEIHDSGDRSGNNEVDINGITNGSYIDRLWVLENHIYNLGGDSIRIGQNEARMPAPNALPSLTYVGRNRFHDNGENAIDVKHSTDVIISENELFGFRPSSSSSGEAIVIHENASNVWIIGNLIHDAAIGIINTGALNTWYISNTLHDITTPGSFDPDSHFGSGVAMHFRGTSSGGIVSNTLYKYDKGVQISGGTNYQIFNNIFSARNRSNSFDVMVSNTSLARDTQQDNNLYDNFRGRVSGSSYTSMSSFQSSIGSEGQGVNGNASFFNADAGNFTLTTNSDAIDAGVENEAFELFRASYGISIAIDRDSIARPLGQGWDIGAHEFVSGPRPKSPSNLNAADP